MCEAKDLDGDIVVVVWGGTVKCHPTLYASHYITFVISCQIRQKTVCVSQKQLESNQVVIPVQYATMMCVKRYTCSIMLDQTMGQHL